MTCMLEDASLVIKDVAKKAVETSENCIHVTDESAFQQWSAYMASGDFAKAWDVNIRAKRHWPSAHSLFTKDLAPREELTVYGLHGLGDIVQMIQYAEWLQRMARRVTYVVPHSLEPLMTHFVGVEHVRRLPELMPLSLEQNSAEIMELPFIFRTAQDELPIATRYLDRTGELRNRFARRCPHSTKALRVGLAWEGSRWDTERWIPLQELAPLFEIKNVEYWRLQGSVGGKGLPFQPDEQIGEGLVEMAGMIGNLDVVLTIDSLSAHLAGALGVPTWVLLKHDPDWRWLKAGQQSLWYPTATLFRQPRPGDWKAVIAMVGPMLELLAGAAEARHEAGVYCGIHGHEEKTAVHQVADSGTRVLTDSLRSLHL